METAEINALEMRFKATVFLLMECGLMKGEIDKFIDRTSIAFDNGKHDQCKKMLDLLDARLVEVFEPETVEP